jgi:hypothetical protein
MKNKITLCIMLFAYHVLSCQVTIGQIQFEAVAKVQQKSSWKELTDVAEIELPKEYKFEEKLVRDYIKRGQNVRIKLGYDGNLLRTFEGFVRELEGNIPIKVLCEDYSYLLKQNTLNKSYAKTNLKEVVGFITQGLGFDYQAIDIDLGKFSIQKANAAQVLQFIRDNYGLVSYFRHNPTNDSKPVLIVGFPYDFKPDTERTIFDLQKNIVSHNLKYKDKEDMKLRIKAISNLPSGKKIVVEVGEKGEGVNVQTRNYGALDKTTLEKYANQELKKVRFDGYRGGLTSFGIPAVEHGETIELLDAEYPDRRGAYLVDAVGIDFSASGYRRTIEIGQKV